MSFVSDARAEQAQQRARTLRAIAGIPEPEPESEPSIKPKPVPFDGGARKTPECPITHAETLTALLASHSAHVMEFDG